MTREEAIETLRANYPDKCYELLRNAVDIAIEALKAEPKDCKKCKSHMAFLMAKMAYDDRRVEPRHGRWKQIVQPWYECSECGERTAVVNLNGEVVWNYCPNCGAQMMDEVEE